MRAPAFFTPGRHAPAAAVALALAGVLSACGGGGSGGGADSGTGTVTASQAFRPAISAKPQMFALAANTNLLTNPGFESAMTDWADWGNTLVVDGAGASGAGHALRAGTAAGGAGHDVAGIVGGTHYHLSAQAKVSAAGEAAYVGINLFDAANNVVAQQAVPITTTAVSLAALDITAPANAVKANVFLWKSAGSGYAFVDDFTLGAADASATSTTSPTPTAPAPTVTSGANLVAEPGFESGLSAWSNWGNASAEAGQGSSGAVALRVGTGAGGVGQDIPGVTAGGTYHLTGKVRVSAASEVAYFGVAFLDAQGAKLQDKNVAVNATAYTAATLDVVAPANSAKATVYVWKNAGSGYAYVDDVTLGAAAASTTTGTNTTGTTTTGGSTPTSPAAGSTANLVAEPGFESALSAWSNWGNASAAAGQGSSGAAALRVGTGGGGVGQNIAGIAAGGTYHLTGKVRVSAASEVAYLGVAFLDAQGVKLQDKNVPASALAYTAANLDVVAPANSAKAMVYVWKNAGSGYAYVDDIAMAATGAAASAVPAPTPSTSVGQTSAGVPTLGDCQLFPANAIFNTRIDDAARFPRHPMSAAWTSVAGAGLPLQTDWGVNADPANYSTYWGMPINVGNSSDSAWPLVSFDFSSSGVFWDKGYPFKSDCAVADGAGGYGIQRDCTQVSTSATRFPFPPDGKLLNENGQCNDPNQCGDHHVLVVEQGACRLWESYFSYKLNGQWYSMATAAWDMHSLAMRPDDWASADAAGLPITPFLAKTAEANSGEIRHALRVVFRDSALAVQHVWPARFAAGADNPGAIPFGALLRLRADFVIPDNWTVQAKAIATAAKRYGMYVADNGSDFHIQGEPNAGWDLATSQQLKSITLGNMEFVDLRAITTDPRFDPNSMAASW
jgi:hypothetical protein